MLTLRRTKLSALLAFLLAIAGTALGGRVVYVDADATGENNGTSWSDAYTSLRLALEHARPDDEIRVARGLYRPTTAGGDRGISFSISCRLALLGGFAGLGATDPNARDFELYGTVLSGDLNGDDAPTAGPGELTDEPTRNDNSRHVITVSDNAEGPGPPVLDGFTITGGNADHPLTWPPDHRSCGAGLYVAKKCNVKVLNCSFTANSAQTGAALFYDHSASALRKCTFTKNAAQASGGAIHDGWSSSTTVTDCKFNDNWATEGGAVSSEGSKTLFTRCTFSANSAVRGGAIYNAWSHPTARNCLFTGNLAKNGGAIHNWEESEPILLNCTFSGNAAPYDPNDETGGDGGAICNWEGSRAKISNCIFWANTPDQIGGQHAGVEHSCIEGWTGGSNGGNIADDPCFVDPGYWTTNGLWVDGDYHLKSQAGRFEPGTRTWLVDDVTSPCIDAGDMLSPIGLEPFPNGGIVNIGAYGATAEASKSYFGEPLCKTVIAGDINGDCSVDFADFCILALQWLKDGNP